MISAALLFSALLQVSTATSDTLPAAVREAQRVSVDTVTPVDSTKSTELGPVVHATTFTLTGAPSDTGAVRRKKAIEYSDLYETRATIHRVASYAIVPLFVAQYMLGQKLMNDNTYSQNTRNLHSLAAGGVAALFAVNTVTGAWNLWDSRSDPAGRTRRYVHTILMLASDAGFIATGATANFRNRSLHRNLAVGSMGLSVGSAAMMWFWKN